MTCQAVIKGVLFSALSLVASSACASPTAEVRTVASVEIRDAASLSVSDSAPLQLLLTSGSRSFFAGGVAPAFNGVPASERLSLGSSFGEITVSGFAPAMTASGEVLSVSMTGEAPRLFAAQADSQRPVRAIIAQFN